MKFYLSSSQPTKNSSAQRGFTLIEIMVVVVILGILAAMVIPNMMSRPEEARIVRAKQDILALSDALDLYKLDNGSYPSTDQGLQSLVKQPTAAPIPAHWREGGYLKSLPKDPWDQDYQYLNPGQHGEIDIYSNGAPGKNSPIGNWQDSAKDSNNNAS